jgi:hypothetical protein
VPQGLTYLVDDVARKHGRLRGGAAASFLRSDDEVLIAEVLASAAAGQLELRRIAPTVAVSPLPLAELMDGLRGAGFTPAAEDQGGAVLDLTDRGRRIPPRPRVGAPRAGEPDPEQLHRLVSRMRAGDALVGLRRGTDGHGRAPAGRAGRPSRFARRRGSGAACGSGSSTGTGWAGSRAGATSVGGGSSRTRQRGRRLHRRPAAPGSPPDCARRGLTPTSHSPSSGAASRARRAR